MPVPLLDLHQQHEAMLPTLMPRLEALIRSGQFILGSTVETFEAHLAAYCQAGHAVGLSSGTDALLAAMMAMDIGPGDEVIVPTFTFFATAGCVSRLGATPVFVDIDPASFNMTAEAAAAAITPRTRAIMPVHLFGQAADMGPILELAAKHDLAVIEDAAQAIGAADGGRRVGAIGRVGCLSFYPTKNLAAMGDAGACTTDDADLAERIRRVRLHGQTGVYEHAVIGGNFRIDAMQALVLDMKLPLLDDLATRRREHACRYHGELADLPLSLPDAGPDKVHVFNQYTVRVQDGRRDALREHLRAAGIGCNVYYPLPLHLQPCFASLGGQVGEHPVSERACRDVLSLPVFPEMTDAQQAEVIAAVRGFYRG